MLFGRPIREESFQDSSVDLIPFLVSLKELFEAFDEVSLFFGQQRWVRHQRKIVRDLFSVLALLIQDYRLFPKSLGKKK